MSHSTKTLLIVTIIATILAFCKQARAATDEDTRAYVYFMHALEYWKPGIKIPSTTVKVVDTLPRPTWVAMCNLDDNAISLRREAWDRASHVQKMYIMVHEVGHCVFGKYDVSDENDIMYSHTPSIEVQHAVLKKMKGAAIQKVWGK